MAGWRRPAAIGAATVIFLASGWAARRHTVGPTEQRIFRRLNDASAALHAPIWLVMQSGSLGSVVVMSELLRRRGHPERALAALAAGTTMWAGAKLVKPYVGRGRPDAHLDEVSVRGAPQTGLGFPSGHAAVAVTLAVVAAPPGRRGLLTGLLTAAGITGLARIYVGAHLPLDVAGGAALGVLVGGAGRAVLAHVDGS